MYTYYLYEIILIVIIIHKHKTNTEIQGLILENVTQQLNVD